MGLFEVASIFENLLSYFGVDRPEEDLEMRVRFVESLPEDYSNEFSKISEKICGNELIWINLEKYKQENRGAILAA